MKTIMSALAASMLLAGLAAPASAETFSITSVVEEVAKDPVGEISRFAKEGKFAPKRDDDDEYIADKRETGSEGWWQQMDRERRGGRR